MKVFFNGSFIEKEDVKISPDDRGFLFGDGVYEVIRSYNGKFFMFSEHISRLNYSLKELKINYYETDKLEKIAKELLKLNSFENIDATVYIQITRGVAVRSLKFPGGDIMPTVYITLNKLNEHYYSYKNGISAFLVDDIRWKRCDIKSVNLLANVIAHNQAIDNGSEIGLFVKDGIITEGTHVGVFGVKNGSLITHPAGKEILPSITRKVIFDLCIKLEIPVLEQAINPENVFNLDELFVVGTSPEIAPVISLNKIPIANGKPGIISIKLQNAFNKLIKGI
ncbi:MAG: aminotransferase class IV [Bacteroidales bacterium]|nr:aminotransferase class IV [Bacteroidales bacterium]